MENTAENLISRRKALAFTASLLGTVVVGSEVFLSACDRTVPGHPPFDQDDIRLLDAVGETILPATEDSPGAAAAHIGDFMKTIVEDCYSEEEYKVFVQGLQDIRDRSARSYDDQFTGLTSAQQMALLAAVDREARAAGDSHYFTMMHQLTLWGYFTSQPGATKALRYVPIPGRYDGCIPYHGERAWA